MPTVLRIGPYRFFFYSGDSHEPAHVHVEHDTSVAKFWLDPVRPRPEPRVWTSETARDVDRLVNEHAEALLEAWNDHFG